MRKQQKHDSFNEELTASEIFALSEFSGSDKFLINRHYISAFGLLEAAFFSVIENISDYNEENLYAFEMDCFYPIDKEEIKKELNIDDRKFMYLISFFQEKSILQIKYSPSLQIKYNSSDCWCRIDINKLNQLVIENIAKERDIMRGVKK